MLYRSHIFFIQSTVDRNLCWLHISGSLNWTTISTRHTWFFHFVVWFSLCKFLAVDDWVLWLDWFSELWELSILYSIKVAVVCILSKSELWNTVLTFLPKVIIIFLLLYDRHSYWTEVEFHYGLCLHFPDGLLSWACFHVSVGHLHFILWKLPLHVIYVFLNSFVSLL